MTSHYAALPRGMMIDLSNLHSMWLRRWRARIRRTPVPGRDAGIMLLGFSVQLGVRPSRYPVHESSISSMAELEDVVAKLLDDPATEPIASEIGGASGLSLFSPMKNHLGKFYSPSTGTML